MPPLPSDFGRLADLPRTDLAFLPTPIEEMANLSREAGGCRLFVKRDDCTGLAFGGNKVRQLEYYFGEALSQSADTVLITGAVQSNYVRSVAAAACKLGMACHAQLEDRVANEDPAYRTSGNVLLDHMLGATIHHYPEGEDEAGADARLEELAGELQGQGKRPYVIHLGAGHPPLGALGYVIAAKEIADQMTTEDLAFNEIIVASGSGSTHAGLLFGLRALTCQAQVIGVCVRREASAQRERIWNHCRRIADMLEVPNPVSEEDIFLTDQFLPPGYGQLNPPTREAIRLAARCEGLILDPVYTGKVMAGAIDRARQAAEDPDRRLLFIHTGGTPAIFGYGAQLTEESS